MKKVVCILITLSLLISSGFATGFPVVDFSHIAATVESIANNISQWKTRLQKWESEYQKAIKAAESITSGDYMKIVDGIVDMSSVLMDYRTTPYALDDCWLAQVEDNVNSIGLVGYSYGMPVKNMLRDNISLVHSVAKVKQTITTAIKREQKNRAGETMTCTVCGGSGIMSATCESCGGTGYNSILDSWKPTDEYEFGEFLEKCKSCGGSGHSRRTCQNCKGTGKITMAETSRKITVDTMIGLMGNGVDILDGIAQLVTDFGDLYGNLTISASEYKQILENTRDSVLKKYDCYSLNELGQKITEKAKSIESEYKEISKLKSDDDAKKITDHTRTIGRLKDQVAELQLLNTQLHKLQVQIDKLEVAAAKEYKYTLYKDIQQGVRKTERQVNQQLEEIMTPRTLDFNRIPASAFD